MALDQMVLRKDCKCEIDPNLLPSSSFINLKLAEGLITPCQVNSCMKKETFSCIR